MILNFHGAKIIELAIMISSTSAPSNIRNQRILQNLYIWEEDLQNFPCMFYVKINLPCYIPACVTLFFQITVCFLQSKKEFRCIGVIINLCNYFVKNHGSFSNQISVVLSAANTMIFLNKISTGFLKAIPSRNIHLPKMLNLVRKHNNLN